MDKAALDAYSTEIARDTLDVYLRSDSQTLGHLVFSLRNAGGIRRSLVGMPDADPRFQDQPGEQMLDRARQHWSSRRGGLPESYSFLWDHMGTGPVFASVSLHLFGAAPTLVLPVPARDLFQNGPEGLRRSVWVNVPEGIRLPAIDARGAVEFALKFSHAVTNTAMEVRVRDEPTQGWLAVAHRRLEGLYIPNVSVIRDTGQARTAARTEERFLAMASVLYLPLDYPELRQYVEPMVARAHIEGPPPAPAVLMLWSPVPQRWDHLVFQEFSAPAVSAVEGSAGVWRVRVPTADRTAESPVWCLAPEVNEGFRWLDLEVAKETKVLRSAESQFLLVFLALHRAAPDSSVEHRELFLEKIGHDFGQLVLSLPELAASRDDKLTVREWVDRMIGQQGGPLHLLRKKWAVPEERRRRVESAPIRLRLLVPPRSSHEEVDHDKAVALLAHLPPEIAASLTPVVPETARALAAEIKTNIVRHAERLLEVCVDVTARFIVTNYELEPQETTLDNLIRDEAGFRRYYAIRRGVIPPHAPSGEGGSRTGHGLGLALHSAVASRTGIYTSLYIAPDASSTHATLAMPFTRLPEGSP